MSEAARTQGWLPPEELERLRKELGNNDIPVDDQTGIAKVRETRRVLEIARKAKLETDEAR